MLLNYTFSTRSRKIAYSSDEMLLNLNAADHATVLPNCETPSVLPCRAGGWASLGGGERRRSIAMVCGFSLCTQYGAGIYNNDLFIRLKRYKKCAEFVEQLLENCCKIKGVATSRSWLRYNRELAFRKTERTWGILNGGVRDHMSELIW